MPGGREPLAPSGEHRNHVHYSPRRQTGIGCVTSRPAGTAPPTLEERIAYALGITVIEVRRLMQEGRVP